MTLSVMSRHFHAFSQACVVGALLLGVPFGVDAEVFKWTDASGRIHYGDEPPENAVGLENVETFECTTPSCLKEQEQRWQEAMEVNRRIQDWLDRRAAERSQAHGEAVASKVFVPMYYTPQAAVFVHPSAVHSSVRFRSPSHHHRKRHQAHGLRPPARVGAAASHRHRARVPSRRLRISVRK